MEKLLIFMEFCLEKLSGIYKKIEFNENFYHETQNYKQNNKTGYFMLNAFMIIKFQNLNKKNSCITK